VSFPLAIEITVLWGDMDALGHVNNAVYARWLEQARIEYFQKVGVLGSGGAGPILARQSIDFRSPVTYPDRIRIEVGVDRIGTTSLVLRYRGSSKARGGVVIEAESIIVLYDYSAGHKVPIDDALRERIDAFQGT
jgi:acyl-CoA thioester hydrolase